MPSIATWNINSIRTRMPLFLEYLENHKPDILLLQEIKVETASFPYLEIESLGYNCAVHGQKSYNGVAILSKFPIDEVVTVLGGDEEDVQSRYIEATVSLPGEAWRVASVYVPNGQSPDSDKFQYKLKFFDRLQTHLSTLREYEETCIIGGDYNVAPFPDDVFDPKGLDGTVCYHPEEHIRFRSLTNSGYYDAFRMVNQTPHLFSWWDYRGDSWPMNKGMRIDHLLLSPQAADRIQSCSILKDERAKERPSDHVPVVAVLS